MVGFVVTGVTEAAGEVPVSVMGVEDIVVD